VTVRLPVGMVTEFEVDVEESLFVPLQLPTAHPLDGLAERLIDSPAWYCPDEQPLELAGAAVGSLPVPECERDSV
jgi:hypothetical protein